MPFATKSYDEGSPYTQKLEYTAGVLTYVGWTDPGQPTSAARWKIQKLTTSADGVTDVKWAAGVASFTNIWDNRATYTYS